MSAAAESGIPLALLAAASYNVGLVLEKRALEQMPALDVRRVPRMIASLLTAPAWLTGFALMLAGLGCQAVALTLEPVSVVQPLLSSGIALLLVLSRLMLGEQLGRGELVGVVLIVISVLLLAFSTTSGAAGRHASPGLLAAVMLPTVVVGLLIALSPLRSRRYKHRGPVLGIGYGVGTGLLYGVAALAIKALSLVLAGHHHLVTGIVFSPYLYVLAGCSAAAMLIYQVGLQACRASILVPVSTITSGMYFIVVGTWAFHEHLPASPGKLVMRLAAIAVAVVVLVVLAGKPGKQRRVQ